MTHVPNPMAPAAPADAELGEQAEVTPSQTRRWPWITALAVALVLGITGTAIAGTVAAGNATVAEDALHDIDRLEAKVDNLEVSLERATEERNDARAELVERTQELEEREAAIAAREAELTQEEQAAARREFGNGVHIIGESVEPGTYRANPSGMCYYAWMDGTAAGADIIDNNIVSGPVTVTLAQGDVFESSRCGTWTKAG